MPAGSRFYLYYVLVGGMPGGCISRGRKEPFRRFSRSDQAAREGVCKGRMPKNAVNTGFLRGFKSIDIRATLMILFYIELRDFPVVFEPVLAQKIDAVGFLKELIAHVGFVRQNPADGRVAPFCLARRGGNALSRQRFGDLERSVPCKEITEDATDYFCLFLVDDQPSVLALVVAEEMLVVEAVLAVRELLPLPPADVFADASGFLLSQAAHYCEE